MPRYTVTAEVTGRDRRQVQARFPGATVTKHKRNPSRADRFADAVESIENAKSIIDELTEELRAWEEGIPENLQGGSKYEEVSAAADALEEIQGALDEAEQEVEFPGMF